MQASTTVAAEKLSYVPGTKMASSVLVSRAPHQHATGGGRDTHVDVKWGGGAREGEGYNRSRHGSRRGGVFVHRHDVTRSNTE